MPSFVSGGCVNPLGMKDGSIPDSQLTASSLWPSTKITSASNARLDRPADSVTTGAWIAEANDVNPWIKADIGTVKYVSGIVLQGRPALDQWVTEYKVQYSYDDVTWSYVKDAGQNSDMVSFLNKILLYPIPGHCYCNG